MNVTKIRIAFIFLILTVGTDAKSQSTPNDFLLTAFEDPNLVEYQSQIDFLERRSYRIPFGDEIEVRYSNDERTLNDSRYQLRFRPSNPWKIRRNNALFNARKESISLRQTLEFKEALMDRYSLIVDYLSSKKYVELSKSKFELSQRKVQLFEQAVQSDLFDARDYVEAKLEVIENLEKYDDQLVEFNQIIENISLILGSEGIEWDDFEVVLPDEIEQIMNNLVTSTFTNTDLQYLRQQVEVARLETSTEQSDFDIGFIQTEYAPYKNNGENELGFSFGITIPIFKNNKDQIADRILDEIEHQNEFQAMAYQDSLNKVLETNFLSNYISHHHQLLKEIERLNIESMTSNLAISEDFNPVTLLELEEGKLKLEEIVHRSHMRLLERYLGFLFAFDALQQIPLLNYLSNDLSFIE